MNEVTKLNLNLDQNYEPFTSEYLNSAQDFVGSDDFKFLERICELYPNIHEYLYPNSIPDAFKGFMSGHSLV
jgi:hypothetical protein